MYFYFYLFIFYFVDYHKTWLSGQDKMICLYFKTPKKFVRLILWYRFSVVYILVVRMVKLKNFAQFPLDYHPLPVLYSLCANYKSDCFVSITT